MKFYQENRPINRPTLAHYPWWQRDLQQLPPRAWCHRCGAEVYAQSTELCNRCRKEELRVEN